MFKIAMLSRWHVHGLINRYVEQLASVPDTIITCVWDEVPERGRRWAEELKVDFEENLDAVLARKDVDGVCITAPTIMHKALIIASAKAGKHIFTEKIMTPNVQDALAIRKVIREAGVKFCISFPHYATPQFAYARKLYKEGTLGDVSIIRIRNGSGVDTRDGINHLPDYWFKKEQACGGAMIDLGCHPVYLANWILGEPESVNTTFTHIFGKEVEDAAVCNIKFKNKAIAVLESNYDSPAMHWYTFEIFGSKALYITHENSEYVTLKRYGCDAEQIPVSSMPAFDPLPIKQWINACTSGGNIQCGIDEALMLTCIMEAAYKSDEEGRTIKIDTSVLA
jgi:predicted dehydrogenase